VTGLNQPGIPAGKTFVYEFEARRPGTFMYHRMRMKWCKWPWA